MSEENGKVCCNCRHNIRTQSEDIITCHCEMDEHYIGYIAYFEGWCRPSDEPRQSKKTGIT